MKIKAKKLRGTKAKEYDKGQYIALAARFIDVRDKAEKRKLKEKLARQTFGN